MLDLWVALEHVMSSHITILGLEDLSDLPFQFKPHSVFSFMLMRCFERYFAIVTSPRRSCAQRLLQDVLIRRHSFPLLHIYHPYVSCLRAEIIDSGCR